MVTKSAYVPGVHKFLEKFINNYINNKEIRDSLMVSLFKGYVSKFERGGEYVEYLPSPGNGRRTDTVSLLREKETDNRRTDKYRPNRPPRYRQK